MTTLMRGAGAVRGSIEAFLKGSVPTYIDQARPLWGLSNGMLPYPDRYDAFDPYEVQEYPIVGSFVESATSWARLDNDVTVTYFPKWVVQIALWAEGPRFDDVTKQFIDSSRYRAIKVRDDLMAVLTGCILNDLTLGQPEGILVDEGSIQETFLEPTKMGVNDTTWIAGGLLRMTLQANEYNFYDTPILETFQMNAFGYVVPELFPPEEAN